MDNSKKYTNKLPVVAKFALTKHLFEQVSNDNNAIELVISIKESGLNVKELSSYLDFIYKIDGHLSDLGYLKYVHNQKSQIEIDCIFRHVDPPEHDPSFRHDDPRIRIRF